MKETISKIRAALEEAYQEHNRLDAVFAVSKQRIGTFERQIEFIKQHPRYNALESVEKLHDYITEEEDFNIEIVEKIYALEDMIKSLETACGFADLFESKYLEEE